jgi:hypothetical protein
MSTASGVRTVWNTYVFAHSTVTALTTKIYNYDIVELASRSQTHDAKLLYNQVYNFIQYRVTKTRQFGLTNKAIYTFPVTIQYYKEADIDGTNFNAVEDAWETIHTRVYSGLGTTWQGQVDYYQIVQTAPEINLVTINDRACWRSQYQYLGIQEASL